MKHFIEECEQYEEIREKLRSKLFFCSGKSEFSSKLFLEVKVEDVSKNVDKSLVKSLKNIF